MTTATAPAVIIPTCRRITRVPNLRTETYVLRTYVLRTFVLRTYVLRTFVLRTYVRSAAVGR